MAADMLWKEVLGQAMPPIPSQSSTNNIKFHNGFDTESNINRIDNSVQWDTRSAAVGAVGGTSSDLMSPGSNFNNNISVTTADAITEEQQQQQQQQQQRTRLVSYTLSTSSADDSFGDYEGPSSSSLDASPQGDEYHCFSQEDLTDSEFSDDGNCPKTGIVNPNYPGFQDLVIEEEEESRVPSTTLGDEKYNNNNNNSNNNNYNYNYTETDRVNHVNSADQFQKTFYDKPKFRIGKCVECSPHFNIFTDENPIVEEEQEGFPPGKTNDFPEISSVISSGAHKFAFSPKQNYGSDSGVFSDVVTDSDVESRDSSFHVTELNDSLFHVTELGASKDSSFHVTELGASDSSFHVTELGASDSSFHVTELKASTDSSFHVSALGASKVSSFHVTDIGACKDDSFHDTVCRGTSFQSPEYRDSSLAVTEFRDSSYSVTESTNSSFHATKCKDSTFHATPIVQEGIVQTALFPVGGIFEKTILQDEESDASLSPQGDELPTAMSIDTNIITASEMTAKSLKESENERKIDIPEIAKKKDKTEMNSCTKRNGKRAELSTPTIHHRPYKEKNKMAANNRKSLPLSKEKLSTRDFGLFDVYNIETAMPKIDLDAIESHLKAASEQERRRRNDRDEIRRRLAMGTDMDDFYGGDRPGRKPSLQARLQSGMNLQICFMNETISDNDSPNSDTDMVAASNNAASAKEEISEAQRPATLPVKSVAGLPPSHIRPSTSLLSLPLKKELRPMTEAEFFACQAQLQSEARLALSQAKEMARMQMEVERQQQPTSPITEMVRCSLEKVGIKFPEDRRRLSRQMLTEMNVAQLQVIVNEMHTQIEVLNETLVKFLMDRDDYHMEQDSMLVDIEDLTRYLGGKEKPNTENLIHHNNQVNRSQKVGHH